MDSLREVIFDVEADGLLDTVSKIHCLSYRFVDTPDKVTTLTNGSDIYDWISGGYSNSLLMIGHNIIGYDFKALSKILNCEPSGKFIDTLPLSWYLNHDRILHGLESYGEDYGYPKPVIDDWETQTIEDYTNRCEVDTMINLKLWLELKGKLQVLYE